MLQRAEAGWFSPRSWTYWHRMLGGTPAGPVTPQQRQLWLSSARALYGSTFPISEALKALVYVADGALCDMPQAGRQQLVEAMRAVETTPSPASTAPSRPRCRWGRAASLPLGASGPEGQHGDTGDSARTHETVADTTCTVTACEFRATITSRCR